MTSLSAKRAAAAEPWTPPRLERWAAKGANALLGRDLPDASVEGLSLTAWFGPCPPPHVLREALRLDGTVGGEAAALFLPAVPLRRVLAAAGGPGVLESDPEAALLLLEAVLAPLLVRAEAALGAPIAFLGFGADGPLPGPVLVGVHGRLEGLPFAGALAAGAGALDALARASATLPRRAGGLPSVPVVLAWRLGLTRVTAAGVLGLQPGDAVILQETGLDEGRVTAVLGERWAVPVHLAPGGAVLEAAPRRLRGAPWEGWAMADGSGEGAGLAWAAAGELQVALVFELGRRLCSLDEVCAMVPGQVMELDRDASGPVDILANGVHLGRGELVRVGDALAVRVVALAAQGAGGHG